MKKFLTFFKTPAILFFAIFGLIEKAEATIEDDLIETERLEYVAFMQTAAVKKTINDPFMLHADYDTFDCYKASNIDRSRSDLYSNGIVNGLPKMPLFHTYNQTTDLLDDDVTQTNLIVIELPSSSLSRFSKGIRDMLNTLITEKALDKNVQQHIEADAIDLYFVAQDTPWAKNQQLLMRPQSWFDPTCPAQQADIPYNKGVQCTMGIHAPHDTNMVLINGGNTQVVGETIIVDQSTHNSVNNVGVGDRAIISSGDTPHVKGFAFGTTCYFDSLTYIPATNASKARCAITRHLMLSSGDMDAMKTLTTASSTLEELGANRDVHLGTALGLLVINEAMDELLFKQ